MSLAALSNVSIQYGTRRVLSDVSFGIRPGMRIGVIGENGSGKSTILRLISGELQPHAGQVSLAGDTSVWHLRQTEDEASDEATPLDRALALRPEPNRLRREIHSLQAGLGEGRDDEQAAKYAQAVAQYSEAGGYEFEQEAVRHFAGLGLGEDQVHRPLAELSGGEQARAALAVALLSGADLLLLDEPDNHLDIAGLQWLEQALARHPAALVLVSHDRELLEHVATHILEVAGGSVTVEQGGLAEYLARKQARAEAARRQHQARRQRIARLEADIRRTEQQGRRFDNLSTNDHWRRIGKKVARSAVVRKARLERELAEERKHEPPKERRGIALDVASRRTARHLLLLDGVCFSYGERQVLDGVSLELMRGQRVAITGPNGCGKTTLLRIVLGQLAPKSGEAWRSAAPCFYCDQRQAGLAPELSALDMLRRATGCSRNTGHHLLARMNLKNREALKPVGALSGGERTRLLLAVLTNQPAGLLVLDEPTNHLDLPSMEALEQALGNFAGGVLLVSHDRRLVRNVATDMFELKNGGLTACNTE